MECTLKYSDIKEVCRTCMKHADTFHNIKDFQISDMISGCTSLHVSGILGYYLACYIFVY